MTPKDLAILGFLRESREKSALAKSVQAQARLEDAQRRADDCSHDLRQQAEAQVANEKRVYQTTMGTSLPVDEIGMLYEGIENERHRLNASARNYDHLTGIAKGTAVEASAARSEHILRLRQYDKWKKLDSKAKDEKSREESLNDELALEDVANVKRPF